MNIDFVVRVAPKIGPAPSLSWFHLEAQENQPFAGLTFRLNRPQIASTGLACTNAAKRATIACTQLQIMYSHIETP